MLLYKPCPSPWRIMVSRKSDSTNKHCIQTNNNKLKIEIGNLKGIVKVPKRGEDSGS